MRAAFSDTLVALAKQDPNVVLLTGDHGYALFDAFRAQCPDQYINAGIAEQNMVGMAAGLARAGFRPFVYGLAAFVPVRVVEQIKLDIAHDDLPVVLCGDGAGFVYSHLGTSHQSTEDIACTRAIPGLDIYSPADRFELEACMRHAYGQKKPVYLRMGKSDRGDVHQSKPTLEAGALLEVRQGVVGSMSFIATGSMVKAAVELAEKEYPEATVWSAPFVKPIQTSQLLAIAQKSSSICVFEEHSVMGGFGSAVTEICSEYHPLPILRVGVRDRFSKHCGSYDYLLKEHGLDWHGISTEVKRFFDAAR